jgi:LAS superfamily LD-carboxypeptidase LdcB
MGEKYNRKEMLTILILTLVFSVGVYFLAKAIDSTVTNIAETEYKIDELTRVAVDAEAQAERIRVMDEFQEALAGNLGGIEDIPEMLQQLETISSLAGSDLTINIEDAVIGEEEIEFKDENKTRDFLTQLEVKEFSTSPTTTTDTGLTNVALTMMEEEEEERLKINYIEVDLVLKGTYNQIRTFIELF